MGAQWKARGKLQTSTARGKIFSKLSKEIILAAAAGADPAMNARLRAAIEAAKKQSMPRDSIERATKKGAGLLEPTSFETVTYEGFAPHHVPVIVECVTDNRKRTGTSVKYLFRNGQLGNPGSVSWDFTHVGLVDATRPDAGGDPEDAAIESGAQDCEVDDDGVRFYTDPTDLDAVSKALSSLGWTVATMRLGWRAKHPVAIDDVTRVEVEQFLADLDDDDDVQHIYTGLA